MLFRSGLSGFRRRSLGSRWCWALCPWQKGAVCVVHALQKDLQSFHRIVAASQITHVRYKRSAIVSPPMVCSSTVLHCVQKICNHFATHDLQPDSPAFASRACRFVCAHLFAWACAQQLTPALFSQEVCSICVKQSTKDFLNTFGASAPCCAPPPSSAGLAAPGW